MSTVLPWRGAYTQAAPIWARGLCSGPRGPTLWANSEPVATTQNQSRDLTMTEATARHILVSSAEECETLKSQIEAGTDFSDVAREHSQCPSSREGGNLGSFKPGMMVAQFDQVVFNSDVGTVHGPVKTDFGYHLIEITNRTD